MRNIQSQKTMKYKSQILTDIVSLSGQETLSRANQLASASVKGLRVYSDKKGFLIPTKDFSKILNHPVELFLSQYELKFHGVIKKIQAIEKDLFEIQIDFTEDTPHYYRECVEDLLN